MFKNIAYNIYKILQKLFQTDTMNKYQHLSESQYPYTIELENGEMISSRGFSKINNNKIETAIYRDYAFPLTLVGKYYARLGNLIFLLLFLITLTSDIQQSDNELLTSTSKKLLIYLLPTCISLAIFVSKELIYDHQKYLQDLIVNQRKVTIFRKMKKFFQQALPRSNSKEDLTTPISRDEKRKSVTSQKFTHMLAQIKSKNQKIPIFDITQWQLLEVGDIVYLKKHEIAPTDLLVLDISDSKCLIHNQNMGGKTEEIEKQAPQLTQVAQQQKKQNGFEYKRILTGTLKYDNKEVDGRQGFIRLKKDPKGEDFNSINIIQREQILVGCDYVYGLVLLTGQDSICYQNHKASQVRSKSGSFFHTKSDLYFLLSLFNILIIALISWIIADYCLCRVFLDNEETHFYLHYETLIFFLNNYLQIFPHFFYAFFDLIEIANTIIKKYQYEQKKILNLQMIGKQSNASSSPTNRKKPKGLERQLPIKYKQLNPCNISDIVMTQYVCLDKTGTLTREQTKVKVMLISDQIYKFSTKKMKINAWKNFKTNIINQIQSNQQIGSEVEENSDPEESIEKVDTKQQRNPFKLSIIRSNSVKRRLSRNTIVFGDSQSRMLSSKKMSENTPMISTTKLFVNDKKQSGDFRSPSIRNSNENNEIILMEDKALHDTLEEMIENIRIEDLEDSHYKFSPSKSQKQKPFLNRPINSAEQSLISSPNNGAVVPLIQVVKQLDTPEHLSKTQPVVRKSLDGKDITKSMFSDAGILRKSYLANQNGTKSMGAGKQVEDLEQDIPDFQDHEDFFKKMHYGVKSTMYSESVLILALCHMTTTKFVYSEDCFINDAQLYLDNQLMKFAESFDIKFICSSHVQNKITYIIQFKDTLHEFDILAFHKETSNHKRFGVLLRFPEKLADQFGFNQQNLEEGENENYYSVFILRDEVLTLPPYLDLDKITKDYWDKYLNKIHINGYRTVIFSKTYLTEPETIAYLECYESLGQQLAYEEDEFEELYGTLEKNMSLINVIGLEEKLRKNAVETIKQFKDCKIKTWILSGDEYNRVLPVAYKTGITDRNLQSVYFDSVDYEEIKVMIKQYLQVMCNQLKNQNNSPTHHQASKSSAADRYPKRSSLNKMSPESGGLPSAGIKSASRKSVKVVKTAQHKNFFFQELKGFNLFLNGDTFDIIYHDRYLFNHFCFILYFSESLVAYNLKSNQKGEIVDIIHKKFPGNQRALAIGDAYNDLEMFTAADIGIQLQSMMQGFNENKERFEQFSRKNSLFQPKTKFFNRIQTNIKKKKHDENPTKTAFVHRTLWQIPTADFIVQKFDELQWLVFFESRLFAELYDDMLIFAFYRGFLLTYTQTIWFAYFCGSYKQVIDYEMFLFFQSLYLISIFIFHAYVKFNHGVKITETVGIKLFQEQFPNNIRQFKKKKLLAFIIKINLNAILEAGTIVIFLEPLLGMYPTQSGRLFETNVTLEFIYWGVILSDLIKYCMSANLSIKQSLVITIIYVIITLFYNLIAWYSYTWKQAADQSSTIQVISDPSGFLILVAYLFIQISVNSVLNIIITPLFSQPMFKNTDDLENLYENYLSQQSISKDKFNLKIRGLYRKITDLTTKIFSNHEDQEIELSIQQMVSGGNMSLSSDKLNPWTLQFTLKDVETKFRRVTITGQLNFHKYHHLMSTLSYDLIMVFIFIFNSDNKPYEPFFVIYMVSFSISLAMNLMIWSEKYERQFFLVNTITVSVRILCKILYDIVEQNYLNNGIDSVLMTQLCSFFIIVVVLDHPLIILIGCFAQTLSFMIKQSENQYTQQDSSVIFNWYLLMNKNVIALSSYIILAILKYKLTFMSKKEFLLDNSMKQETQQINDVLEILLPKFIRDRIDRSGQFDISENQGDVSILFCDICGFDKIVNSENEKIVHLLDSLFRAFDSLCAQNGMQKIETVGKTYMAAGGLKAVDQNTKYANIDPVKRAINQALEMQQFVKKFKFAKVGNLQIKIGIHYGRVIAGVIGHHKPQFSLIGDTVNTTSRVCSTGQDGEITISQRAYDMVDMPELSFDRREVEAKGKGIIVTYQVSTEVKRNRKYRKKMTQNNQDPQGSNETVPPKKKPPKGDSFNVIEEEGELVQESDRKQSWIDMLSGEFKKTSNSRKVIRQRTRVLKPSHPSSHSILRQQSQFMKSGNNLNGAVGDGTPTPKQRDINDLKDDQSDNQRERQNLLQVLEQQLRKELIVEILEENIDIEMDKDRARAQYMNDDGDLLDNKVEKLSLNSKKLYLQFEEHQEVLAQKFFSHISQSDYKMCCNLIMFSTLCFSFKSFSFFMLDSQQASYLITTTITLRVIVCVMLFALSVGLHTKYKDFVYQQNVFLIIFAVKYFIYVFESCVLQFEELAELQISEGILILNLFTSIQLIQINKKILIFIVYFLGMIIIESVQTDWPWRYLYYVLMSGFLQFWLQYRQFGGQINNFNNKLLLEHKRQQQSNLVMYLLPRHILDEFYTPNKQRKALTDYCKEGTLLFADIVGFTEYSNQVEPEQVVNMLRNLFTEFDKTCLAQNAYKLYTIGDCYVVMGMVDATDRQPAREARNVVELGFLMIEIIRQVRVIINFQGLDMRIGVHTGNIIGGVLGTEIVRYDIYGADVMIANKMESNGVKGQVQVSEETKQLLETSYPFDFVYEFNKTIEFTSIGRKTNGYIIYQAQNENSYSAVNDEIGNFQEIKSNR